jgi:pyruvate/2-oxoglutarate dehydrogenase complex dihydrolipoamide acyltransferase (E2) component
VRPRPWAVGDRVEVRPVLRLCATFDHRLIDGAAAGRFAARLGELFAAPALLA